MRLSQKTKERLLASLLSAALATASGAVAYPLVTQWRVLITGNASSIIAFIMSAIIATGFAVASYNVIKP